MRQLPISFLKLDMILQMQSIFLCLKRFDWYLLKLSQFYALINGDESIIKGYTTEKIGDYSYTLGDGSSLQKPDVYALIKDYVKPADPDLEGIEAKVRMRSI